MITPMGRTHLEHRFSHVRIELVAAKAHRTERRRDALSKERIVEAAIEILDTEGESAPTFRALTARLATGARTPLDQVSAQAITQWSMNDFGSGQVMGRCAQAYI
jgi:cobalamin biosynthesis protein CbiD